MVLFFYGVGQYVMVLFADAGARTAARGRAGQLHRAGRALLGLVLLVYKRYADALSALRPDGGLRDHHRAWSSGWLVVEVWSSPGCGSAAFDTEYVPRRPSSGRWLSDGGPPGLLA